MSKYLQRKVDIMATIEYFEKQKLRIENQIRKLKRRLENDK
jgi:hypothetical protein